VVWICRTCSLDCAVLVLVLEPVLSARLALLDAPLLPLLPLLLAESERPESPSSHAQPVVLRLSAAATAMLRCLSCMEVS
jgi:hypothetical protein